MSYFFIHNGLLLHQLMYHPSDLHMEVIEYQWRIIHHCHVLHSRSGRTSVSNLNTTNSIFSNLLSGSVYFCRVELSLHNHVHWYYSSDCVSITFSGMIFALPLDLSISCHLPYFAPRIGRCCRLRLADYIHPLRNSITSSPDHTFDQAASY